MRKIDVAFVSNYINHHQIPFCENMCCLLRERGGSFVFIQTEPMEEERVKMGWKEENEIPYVKHFYEEEEYCRRLIMDSDVVLFGGCDDERYIEERLNEGKIVVRISERLYKTGQWKAISPRGLIRKYHDHTRYRKAPVYLLCAGGYVASDFHIVRAYPEKMYKWGYFPRTEHYDVDKLMAGKGYGKVPYILWAGRFIDWKHPELALETAEYLKDKNISFHMDMIGGGEMEQELRDMLEDKALSDRVTMLGFKTPDEVRGYMEKADIFLFTSDRQEGWGAVLNEAMNSGCAVVADHMIGAVPYLIRQGYNGRIYRDGEKQSLFKETEHLILNTELRDELGRNACKTITDVWNPQNAAKKLIKLLDDLMADGKKPVRKAEQGAGQEYPCAPESPTPEKRMYKKLNINKFKKARKKLMSDINSGMYPLITVIVPVYNIIEYLPRCVHSITGQTYRNLEIILVDDGSTDGTDRLCDELAEEDDRIKVLHKENGGSSSARNLGLKAASGEYIGFIDSDDYIDSDMYERLYEGIHEYNVRIAQIGRDEIDADGRRLPNICEPPASPVCIEGEDFMRELLMHRGDCSFCTKLIDRELLCEDDAPFPVGRLNEDFELLVRLLPGIDRILSLPGQTYHVFYRIGSNSRKADRNSFSRVFGDCVDNADRAAGIVEESYPSLKDEALRFSVFQRIEYLLHIPISRMTKDNEQYMAIVRWMRKNLFRGLGNKHLTVKNKCYHIIFSIAPRTARLIHKKIKKL